MLNVNVNNRFKSLACITLTTLSQFPESANNFANRQSLMRLLRLACEASTLSAIAIVQLKGQEMYTWLSSNEHFASYRLAANHGQSIEDFALIQVDKLPDGSDLKSAVTLNAASIPINIGEVDFPTFLLGFPEGHVVDSVQLSGQFTLLARLVEDALLDDTPSLPFPHSNDLQVKDKIIGTLGHDIRNPMGAILNVSELLLRMPVEDRIKRMANIVQTAAQRMRLQIENLLDFTRSELGAGIKLYEVEDDSLFGLLEAQLGTFRSSYPDRELNADLNIIFPLYCDAKRLAQLVKLLLENAFLHGQGAVDVVLRQENQQFMIEVQSQGPAISKEIQERLFKPFDKATIDPEQRGIAMGLYMASEIAKAHGGKLNYLPGSAKQLFYFSMSIKS